MNVLKFVLSFFAFVVNTCVAVRLFLPFFAAFESFWVTANHIRRFV